MDIQTSEQTYQQSVVRSVSPIRPGGKDKCFSNSGLKGVSCKYIVQICMSWGLRVYCCQNDKVMWHFCKKTKETDGHTKSKQTYQQSIARSVSSNRLGGKDKCFSNSGVKGV